MTRFAFQRGSEPGDRYAWRQLHLVTDNRVVTLDLEPALIAGWSVKSIHESGQDDWPGYDATGIADWIRQNWAPLTEIHPDHFDDVLRRYRARIEDR